MVLPTPMARCRSEPSLIIVMSEAATPFLLNWKAPLRLWTCLVSLPSDRAADRCQLVLQRATRILGRRERRRTGRYQRATCRRDRDRLSYAVVAPGPHHRRGTRVHERWHRPTPSRRQLRDRRKNHTSLWNEPHEPAVGDRRAGDPPPPEAFDKSTQNMTSRDKYGRSRSEPEDHL